MTALAAHREPQRRSLHPSASTGKGNHPTIGATYRGLTVNVPSGPTARAFVVSVPYDALVSDAVFGAVLCSAIPRTQGLHLDQHRYVLLALARNWGRVRETATDDIQASEPLAGVLARLRTRTTLPAAEIARMLGIQRRQLYNLVDGGSTTPEREQRIRTLGHVIDSLFERLGDVGLVRSALLAPIGTDLRSFVDLATEGGAIADADKLLEQYLDSRGNVTRRYLQTPRRARQTERLAAKAIEDTLDISPAQ
jgi:hypothetical protein